MTTYWLAISLLVVCGVFISPAKSREAGVWVIERRAGFGRDSFPCWISTSRRVGLVTFTIIEAQMFFSEQEAKNEIDALGLSDSWFAVEKGGSQ